MVICLSLFYQLVISKLTFHYINRFYLLSIVPFSLIIPLLRLRWLFSTTSFGIDKFSEIQDSSYVLLTQSAPMVTNFTWFDLLIIIYWIGVGFTLILLVLQACNLFQIERNSQLIKQTKYYQIRQAKVVSVFSCFHWVFVPVNGNYHARDPIMKHEEAHARMLHTFDLIIIELFCIVNWFNPFVYLFRQQLKSVHEYQADAYVLKAGFSKVSYLTVMLDSLVSSSRISISSYFNNSTIKNRIEMITKNKSTHNQSIRYSIILPVVVLLLVTFAALAASKPSIFPIKEGEYSKISAPFGKKVRIKSLNVDKIHEGIDVVAPLGTQVIATGNGKIVKAGMEGDWGNLVVIDHGDGYQTWYAHLKDVAVEEGTVVNTGAIIGHVGNTGKSTAPHLHYEVRIDGERVDPADYY